MSDKFIFDQSAYVYSNGIKAIALMFEAAKSSLLIQREEIDHARDEYERHLESGGEPIGKWEDGNKLWDQGDLYRLEQLALDDALVELRIAIAIAVYHHWEKSIPNPKIIRNRKHSDLVQDAIVAGIPLHDDIDALCFSANYLKHGSEIWKNRLRDRWKDQFGDMANSARMIPAWATTLNLKDSHIRWFIEIAKVSERPISRF